MCVLARVSGADGRLVQSHDGRRLRVRHFFSQLPAVDPLPASSCAAAKIMLSVFKMCLVTLCSSVIYISPTSLAPPFSSVVTDACDPAIATGTSCCCGTTAPCARAGASLTTSSPPPPGALREALRSGLPASSLTRHDCTVHVTFTALTAAEPLPGIFSQFSMKPVSELSDL